MTIKLESLQSNKGSRRKKMRKGRGIAAGQGASCGFGMRGQKSRSGRPTRPGFEGGQMPLHRRVPMRGFNNSNFAKTFEIVNLSQISKLKVKNVDAEVMSKNGLITTLIQGNIIRITPPLIINKKELKNGLDIILKSL